MGDAKRSCADLPDRFPILNFGAMTTSEFYSLAAIALTHRSIKHALDWLLPQGFAPLDSIAQDEYSHDVLFPYHNGFWLSYECT
jgi:hypothetical protein